MKTLAAAIALTAALLTCGCISDYNRVTEKASPRRLAEITSKDFAWVNLSDGRTLELRPPRDFGDALCGLDGCARKSDIISIDQIQASPDLVGSAGAALVAVPVAVGFAAIYMSICSNNRCGSSHEETPSSRTSNSDNSNPLASLDAPYATDEQLLRQWIDSLVISHLKLVGRMDYVNPCMEAYGERPAPAYATDAEALDAIWQNRLLQSDECLWHASLKVLRAPGQVSRDRAIRLWALSAVKGRWDRKRCLPLDDQKRVVSLPVTPPEFLDLGLRKGDPQALRVIEETLADPASYADETLPDCKNGTRPREEWPAIREHIMQIGPFALPPPLAD